MVAFKDKTHTKVKAQILHLESRDPANITAEMKEGSSKPPKNEKKT